MAELTELRGDELEQADEILDRANHDVGKYMAMTARNVESAALDAELIRLLRRDLEETFGGRAAWDLWAEAKARLVELARDPKLEAIDTEMSLVKSQLRRWTGDDEDQNAQLIERVRGVSDQIRALRLAVRRQRIG